MIFFFQSVDILISEYICEPCKSVAVSSYTFIKRAKKTAETVTNYLKQLDKETIDLASRIVLHSDWKNAVIVLEDPYSKIIKKNEPKKKDTAPIYICDLCGKRFLRKHNLNSHLKQHNGSKISECPHCMTLPCRHEKYILAFNKQKNCVECDKKIHSLEGLIAHVNEKHLNVANICKKCGTSYNTASDYEKHLNSHHSLKYKCNSCFRNFRSKKDLNTHMKLCDNNVKLINKLDMSSRLSGYPQKQMKPNPILRKKITRIKRTYKCSICNKVLEKQLDFRAHVRTHEKKPNECLYCNKQFASRQEYLTHVQTDEHRKSLPCNKYNHRCPHCDYASNSAVMVEAHINRIHLNIRPFKCEHCQSAYFDKKQLIKHMKIHTGQVKMKVCDICGLHLAGPTALKKHRRKHTGERPYPCPYCDIKEICSANLKAHIMRKHMAATISCPLCTNKFHTMANARSHVKKAHWKSKEKFDYTKLKGLAPKDYDFFRDRRKALL